MSATGQQLAFEKPADMATEGRSPLAHLLHALNQPLTGLQCSLELALMGSRTSEQYIRILQEGLELTGRMRVLVEAIRQLADVEEGGTEEREMIPLDAVLKETADELRPVADARNIRMQLQVETKLWVESGRRRLTAALFRFLESALSLAMPGSVFRIRTGAKEGQSWLAISWNEGNQPPQHSPFSRPELGLLIAKASWKKIGADWESRPSQSSQQVRVLMPVVAGSSASPGCSSGGSE